MINIKLLRKVFSVLAFGLMLAANILAKLIPLNGITMGALSDNYPTLITPADSFFRVWFLIFALMLVYVIYQLELFRRQEVLPSKISGYIRDFFILSCLCNAGWIFAWHYRYIALSLALIIAILLCLSVINRYVYSEELSLSENLFMRIPFSIYFGWITVATIMNLSVLSISVGWKGFGIPFNYWAIVAILVILIITSIHTYKNKSVAYVFAVMWAIIGILVEHSSKDGYNGQYPELIITVIIGILILLVELGYIIFYRKKYGF
jgi:hypothetical protein